MIFRQILFSLVILAVSFSNAQTVKNEIESLDKSFKEFKYETVIEKGKFLLGDRFTTKEDSLQIYQYILSSAYALNDTSYAKLVIVDILKLKPDFTLDPQETSPKIIQFFNYVKNELDEKAAVRMDTTETVPITNNADQPDFKPVMPLEGLSSVILPGSGHLLNGSRRKGFLFASASVALIGANIYMNSHTNDLRDKYIRLKKDSPDFDQRYNDYNTSYKIRNALIITYALWNLYCLYDLHHLPYVDLEMEDKDKSVTLSISYYF